jgi:hypothetical protein
MSEKMNNKTTDNAGTSQPEFYVIKIRREIGSDAVEIDVKTQRQ